MSVSQRYFQSQKGLLKYIFQAYLLLQHLKAFLKRTNLLQVRCEIFEKGISQSNCGKIALTLHWTLLTFTFTLGRGQPLL